MTLGVRRSAAIRFDGTARQNAPGPVITNDASVKTAVMAADGLVAAVGNLHGDGDVIFFGRLVGTHKSRTIDIINANICDHIIAQTIRNPRSQSLEAWIRTDVNLLWKKTNHSENKVVRIENHCRSSTLNYNFIITVGRTPGRKTFGLLAYGNKVMDKPIVGNNVQGE